MNRSACLSLLSVVPRELLHAFYIHLLYAFTHSIGILMLPNLLIVVLFSLRKLVQQLSFILIESSSLVIYLITH